LPLHLPCPFPFFLDSPFTYNLITHSFTVEQVTAEEEAEKKVIFAAVAAATVYCFQRPFYGVWVAFFIRFTFPHCLANLTVRKKIEEIGQRQDRDQVNCKTKSKCLYCYKWLFWPS
jgi:hypothetical protein